MTTAERRTKIDRSIKAQQNLLDGIEKHTTPIDFSIALAIIAGNSIFAEVIAEQNEVIIENLERLNATISGAEERLTDGYIPGDANDGTAPLETPDGPQS